ncbi:MAG: hypothetical protein JWO58_1477 [Chitinophagaceae bacterium]|nr:hypothetical protein [Chitinophagaceae bacterium]
MNLVLKESMTTESTYQAAKTVAHRVENIFQKHLAKARDHGKQDLAEVPSVSMIQSIIEAAFWISLRREEGHSPRISLAFLSPKEAGQPIVFEQRIPLNPGTLTKIAPGFERAGVHLGVWYENDEIYVWGATFQIPNLCFVIDVSEPGLVVIKHRRSDAFGKFSNVAVLTGDEVKIVDDYNAGLPDCPSLLKSLLDLGASAGNNDSLNVLLQLSVSMRAHKRGGTLLFVPADSSAWKESVRHPLHHSIEPVFSGLSDRMRENVSETNFTLWRNAISKEVEIIAGLTAIDGAIVMNDRYELLAFGEKIRRREGGAPIEQVVMTEPVLSGNAQVVDPAQNGGTRHLSAAQFVFDQRDTMALVASQDGKFTVFTWSECEGMVQAHRIDALLL